MARRHDLDENELRVPTWTDGKWGALEDVWRDANYNFVRHDAAAIKATRAHKYFGVLVVIITAVVGTSVFGALTQSQLNVGWQILTGALSILATVLAAVQTFFGFAEAAAEHKKASVAFYSIKRQIDVFMRRYNRSLGSAKLEEAQGKENEIIEAFNSAREAAPILPHDRMTQTGGDVTILRRKYRDQAPPLDPNVRSPHPKQRR